MTISTLVHASDLHFGRPHDPEAAAAFHEVVEALAPDVLVISGDFTQRARVAEFEAARQYLDRFAPIPIVVTPGNHDVPLYRVFERIRDPFGNYLRILDPKLDSVTRVAGMTLVSLNTAAPHRAIVNGRLDTGQVAFAKTAFEAAPSGDLRVVVAHHHLAPAPDYQGDRPLPGARRILDAFKAMGVDLILGGHLHRAYIGNSLDVYPGADRSRGIVIAQSGTTTSRRGRARERARNSFNVIRVEDRVLTITHWMRLEGAFRPFSVHRFPRKPSLWFEGDEVTT
jgi:3',5'-cyclic AMP phosphodiesterase CpdA